MHGSGSIMLWGHVAAGGTGNIAQLEGKIDSNKYWEIFQAIVGRSVQTLKLKRGWVFHQDNYTKAYCKINHEVPEGFGMTTTVPRLEWNWKSVARSQTGRELKDWLPKVFTSFYSCPRRSYKLLLFFIFFWNCKKMNLALKFEELCHGFTTALYHLEIRFCSVCSPRC